MTAPTGPADRFDEGEVASTLASSLESLDDAVNYRDWIVELARDHLVAPVLEVGAGHGTFTEVLIDVGAVTSVEPDGASSAVLRERYADDPRVHVVTGTLDDVNDESGGPFGSAVMINVLEHIDDDRDALETLRRLVVPGGCVVIWVPAFMLLYSPFDRRLGHHRRYRRSEVEAVAREAGLDVVDSRYVNLPGWFSWFLLVRLLRREPTSPHLIAIFDRTIVPVVRWIENRLRMPFGQSVLLIARTPR